MPGLILEPDEKTVVEENVLRNRLSRLPVVQSSMHLYQQTKTSSDVLCHGLDFAETGFSIASKPLFMAVGGVKLICPDKVDSLEKNACEYLAKIEERCPSLKLPTEQLIDNMRECVATRLREGVHQVYHSPPSRGVLWGLNCLLGATEKLLDTLGEPQRPPREKDVKRKVTPSTSLVRRVIVFPVTLPLNTVALVLRFFIRWLQSYQKSGKAISYQKRLDIEKRRKVSPRKRLPSSGIAGMMTMVARRLGLIGRPDWNPKDIEMYMMKTKAVKPESLSPLSAALLGKRKHDVMLQEEESEGEEEVDIYDLDDYCSEEDSDYKPDEHPSDDSLEFQEGDTESDIEVEFDGDANSIGLNLQAVRIEGPRRSSRGLARSREEKSDTPEIKEQQEGFMVVQSKKSRRKMKSTVADNNNDPLEKLPEILVTDPADMITPIKDPKVSSVAALEVERESSVQLMNGDHADVNGDRAHVNGDHAHVNGDHAHVNGDHSYVMTPDNKPASAMNGKQGLLTPPHLSENGRLEYTPTVEGDAVLVGMKNNNDSGFDATPI